jgi:hypothetical protein
VFQKFQELSDDNTKENYLEPGSTAYYTYVARQNYNTSLVIFLSDHNTHCANIYLGLEAPPGPKYSIAKVLGGNELIYTHHENEMKYYIAVEATKLCDYSISARIVDSSLHKITRGKQNLLKL